MLLRASVSNIRPGWLWDYGNSFEFVFSVKKYVSFHDRSSGMFQVYPFHCFWRLATYLEKPHGSSQVPLEVGERKSQFPRRGC